MKLIIFEGAKQEEISLVYKQLKEDGFLILSSKPEIIELTDTEKIKLGELEIERPTFGDISYRPELDSDVIDATRKQSPIKKLLKKQSKKPKQNHIPRRKVKYTKEIIERVREVIDEMKNPEIRDLLQKEFGLNVSVGCVVNMMVNRGIKRVKNHSKKQNEKTMTPKQTHDEEIKKQKRKGMSKEAIEIIEDNYMEKTDGELREMIADKVGAFHTVDKIEEYRETNGMIRPTGWNPNDYDDDEEEQ